MIAEAHALILEAHIASVVDLPHAHVNVVVLVRTHVIVVVNGVSDAQACCIVSMTTFPNQRAFDSVMRQVEQQRVARNH